MKPRVAKKNNGKLQDSRHRLGQRSRPVCAPKVTAAVLPEGRLAADLRAITLLYDAGQLCTCSGDDLQACLQGVLNSAMSLVYADKGIIQLLDFPSKRLTVGAQVGFDARTVEELDRAGQIRPWANLAIDSARRVMVEDIAKSEVFAGKEAAQILLKAGVRALQATPLVSSSGHLLGVISTHFSEPRALDVREQRLMDLLARQISDHIERLQSEEAAARLAAIVDDSEDAIISKDLTGTIRSWNKAAERIFGYKAEEVIGKNITIIIPSNLRNEEPGILSKICKGERIDHYQTIRQRKDGTLLNISLTVSPVRDSTGRIIGASKIARDISDQKVAEVALRRSESLFRELADFMPQIVWAARPDGFIDYYNQRWYEYTGRPRNLFGDESWTAVVHPDDLPRVSQTYYDCIRNERPFQTEVRFKDQRTGDYRWFLGRAEPIRDDSGKIFRWFGTCTDIDDQKRAAEKLEAAVAERTTSLREAIAQMEEFSYTISHDLRAPLRAMTGYSQMMLEEFAPKLPEEMKYYLERINTNAKRLDKMVLDLLTYSRVARVDFQLERINVDKLVRQIVEQYPGMRPDEADITVEPLPDAIGHEPSLTQAFSNLLNNAVKFVSPGVKPKIRVWSEPRDGRVRYWVEDNGIGIEPQYQHRIFRMFERVHPQQPYEGTGVGLAIVKKAIERMGGQVGLESDGKKGSKFWLEIQAA